MSFAGTARRLAQRYGSTIDITDPNQVFDDSTLGTTGTPIAMTVRCSSPIPWDSTLGLAGGIQGDLELYVEHDDPARTFVPASGHDAVYGGRTYRVAAVSELRSGTSPIVYRLLLRGLD